MRWKNRTYWPTKLNHQTSAAEWFGSKSISVTSVITYHVDLLMYCFHASLPDSLPPPVCFSPPKAPPISAPLVGMFTLMIPQSEPLGLQVIFGVFVSWAQYRTYVQLGIPTPSIVNTCISLLCAARNTNALNSQYMYIARHILSWRLHSSKTISTSFGYAMSK